MKKHTLVATLLAGVILAGCATDDPNRSAKTGAAIGAVTGAVFGHQVDGNRGKFLGAAIGAITGAAAGNYMDDQQRELERQLEEERQSKEIQLQRVDEETLKLNLDSSVTFDFDSARLKPNFYNSLDKIASIVSKYDKTAVHVIGHTDSTGSTSYNQDLSERRAQSVGSYLGSRGVSYQRIQLEGRGEMQPRADNSTEYGRQQNRRVEVYLKSIVKGREEDAFKKI